VVDQAVMRLEQCMDPSDLEEARSAMMATFKAASSDDKRRMSAAMSAAQERVARIAETFAAAPVQPLVSVPRSQDEDDQNDDNPAGEA
jgi:hypothetical protein